MGENWIELLSFDRNLSLDVQYKHTLQRNQWQKARKWYPKKSYWPLPPWGQKTRKSLYVAVLWLLLERVIIRHVNWIDWRIGWLKTGHIQVNNILFCWICDVVHVLRCSLQANLIEFSSVQFNTN